MDVEVRSLRAFLAVADELHFSRAAERLHISQPALSRQIRELERRVGAQLLIRDTRTVTLTESGKLLHQDATRVLADLHRTVERVQGAARGELGHLSIGFIGSAVESFVVPMLQAVRTRTPGLTFTLTERPWLEQTTGLESASDDLAFVRDLPAGEPWRTVALLTEPLCLVVPDDHPLATHHVVTRDDLLTVAAAPFLTNPSWMNTHCREWPFHPRVADEMITTHGILGLVRARFGISFMPASYQSWGTSGLAFVPVEAQTSTQQLAWRSDRQCAPRDLFLAALPEQVPRPAGVAGTAGPVPETRPHAPV